MTPIRRLLLLAYFYPPLGGPAVQRPCKTVKYLSQLGWETDVITASDIVYHSTDSSLLKECAHRRIFRTASLDPLFVMNLLRKLFKVPTDKLYFGTSQSGKSRFRKLFPIDHKIGWIPFAIRAGKQALLTDKYSTVMVTGGPFSSVLAASRIAAFGKIPLIVDYRDLWTLDPEALQAGKFSASVLRSLERKLLRQASLVTTATALMADLLVQNFAAEAKDKVLPVFNGWDEADFSGLKSKRSPDGTIRIAYVGTLYGERPLSPFYQAWQKVAAENPELRWELQMVGNFYPETHREAQASTMADRIQFIPQQTHCGAIQHMLDADILLLAIGKADRKWVLTGKLFEYLRCQKPILTLGAPDCEAADILTACHHEPPCPIDDTQSISSVLQRILTRLQTQNLDYTIPLEYERSHQINNLNSAILKILS